MNFHFLQILSCDLTGYVQTVDSPMIRKLTKRNLGKYSKKAFNKSAYKQKVTLQKISVDSSSSLSVLSEKGQGNRF